jgi:ankyrin repeat protein
VKIIKILLGNGMSAELTNATDSTSLHFSAYNGNDEGNESSCQKRCSFNITNTDGETPLHLAADYGKIEVFRYHTETGADINIPDSEKMPLFTMLFFGHCGNYQDRH